VIGLTALFILLVSKKVMPKFPMAVALMAAGALMTRFLPVREWGVQTLAAVEPGMPEWSIPDFSAIAPKDAIITSLSVAVVIMAETLLAENSFAQKNGYKIDDNQEIFAFSMGNFVAAFTGCCPINGSVSRSAMGEQYQAKTQLTGIVAGLSMIILLLCGTGFIGYLPIPVLTAIVISALLGATEFELAVRLWKVSRTEGFIFIGAFFGVLMLGTINGVLIGIILSFTEMIIRTSKPARCFLGIQPGHQHFRDLREGSQIHAVEGVLIYRFSSNLFFANIGVLQKDIEEHIKDDTKAVILDAGGIGSLDITAADRLEILYKSLKEKGIRFYMTEHIADVNEQLRKLGLGYLIEEGCVRRTIHIALKDMGINRPYPLEGGVDNEERSASRKRADNRVQEFVWAFGSETEEEIERQIVLQIEQLKKTGDVENLFHGRWAHMEALDEDEWLEHLEEHLKEIVNISGKDEMTLAGRLEAHRKEVHDRIAKEHPELAERFKERRHLLDEHLKEHRPEVYELVLELREKRKE
jgi:MFS superfamily sulfate permease-like transporter